jgi:hypothetical protein
VLRISGVAQSRKCGSWQLQQRSMASKALYGGRTWAVNPLTARSAMPDSRKILRRSETTIFATSGRIGRQRYRPISADREAALVARTIDPDVWANAPLFRGEAQRKSSWLFVGGTLEGPPRFFRSRASFDCPRREFKYGTILRHTPR